MILTPSNFLRHPVLAAAVLFSASLVSAAGNVPVHVYEVTTETGMPHLEENLRYSTTRERRCLAHVDFATAFPVLQHSSLKGCKLDNEQRDGDVISYVLTCDSRYGTTGNAQWRIGERQFSGTLHVKLGGKNMTFYQRVTAIAAGECEPPKQ